MGASETSPLAHLVSDIGRCRKCRDPLIQRADGRSVLTETWMPPRGFAGSVAGQTAGELHRTFMFVTMNPGHPLKMINDRPSVEDAFWHSNQLVEGADPGTRVFDFCTRLYQHQHAVDPSFHQVQGREMRFHKRCLAIVRSCLVLAGHEAVMTRSTWSSHCWMTDAVKCSTERDAGQEIEPCIRNCGTFLRRELELLDPSVIVVFGPSPQKMRRPLLARAVSEAGAPQERVVYWSGKGRSVYQNFAKLEDRVHDDRFEAICRVLGKDVPPDFRTVRASIYREYFPFSSQPEGVA